MNVYSISDLAEEFDITTRTIRFYEEKGLLCPRRDGQTRLYSSSDRARLKLILRSKRLGLSLDESSEIIPMYEPENGSIDQLQKLINKIREKRQLLTEQKHDIEVMLLELNSAERKCLGALVDKQSKPTGTSKSKQLFLK